MGTIEESSRAHVVRILASTAGWVLLFAFATYAGRQTRVGVQGVSLTWPAAGVATVWLLATRGRLARGLVVALVVSLGALVSQRTGFDPGAAWALAAASAVQPVIAVAVLGRLGWRDARPLRAVSDVPVLLTAGLVAGVVSAAVGVATRLWVVGEEAPLAATAVIASRNIVSTFAGAAVLLSLPRLHRSGGPASTPERVVLAALSIAGALLVATSTLPLVFVLVPAAVVLGLRCGPSLTAVVVGAQGLTVVVATLHGHGPFAPVDSETTRVVLAQLLVLVLVLVGIALALEEQERADALERRRQAEERLTHLALHDELTGLPNRALFRDRLDVAVAGSERSGDLLALLYVDVDLFKQINDNLGHQSGDTVLREVAQRLADRVRPGDTVARLGGDEFVVICPSLAGRGQAVELGRRMVLAFDDPVETSAGPVEVTGSVGVTVASVGVDPDELLRRADAALYAAKEGGRARFEVYDQASEDEAERVVRLLAELREAIERGELAMAYQPIVELGTGRVPGVEALVRWQHPERGVVPAGEFIDVVESSDLVFALGRLSLQQTARDGAAALAAGHRLMMHVNISARHLVRPTLVAEVEDALAEHGLPAELLVLEVTETHLFRVSGSLLKDLARLRELGVRIAVDDFGTGYSSPTHLLQMPVDSIKLDRSFVEGVETERGARAVSAGVLAMARGLDIEVIAEGVETAGQEAALRDLGYDLVQGHFYSPTLTCEELLEWLSKQPT